MNEEWIIKLQGRVDTLEAEVKALREYLNVDFQYRPAKLLVVKKEEQQEKK